MLRIVATLIAWVLLPAGADAQSASIPAESSRVRVIAPSVGPGWRTGMLNRVGDQPCYRVLLLDSSAGRKRATATLSLKQISSMQIYANETWRNVPLGELRATERNCPAPKPFPKRK